MTEHQGDELRQQLEILKDSANTEGNKVHDRDDAANTINLILDYLNNYYGVRHYPEYRKWEFVIDGDSQGYEAQVLEFTNRKTNKTYVFTFLASDRLELSADDEPTVDVDLDSAAEIGEELGAEFAIKHTKAKKKITQH